MLARLGAVVLVNPAGDIQQFAVNQGGLRVGEAGVEDHSEILQGVG